MITIHTLDATTMIDGYMLLVRDNVVINTDWSTLTIGMLSVGAGTTAYLFTSLSDLEAYASAQGWELPIPDNF
jgi:hypothetical protein